MYKSFLRIQLIFLLSCIRHVTSQIFSLENESECNVNFSVEQSFEEV